jgi:hypothetical protein
VASPESITIGLQGLTGAMTAYPVTIFDLT